MTITTTYFRQHLAEIIHKVADEGQEVILIFGKGKKAKKVGLSPVSKKEKAKNTMPNLRKVLSSEEFKARKIDPKYQNAKDFKEIMAKYYNLNDFVV